MLALALLSFGVALIGVSPERATGREYWHAFFWRTPGETAYPHPVGHHYVLVREQGEGPDVVRVCSAEEVEAALPEFLDTVQAWPDWSAHLLAKLEPDAPPPSMARVQDMAWDCQLSWIRGAGAELAGWNVVNYRRVAENLLQRYWELPTRLRWKLKGQVMLLALELGLWCALVLLLLGTHLPGRTPPLRAGLRGALFVLLLYALLWHWLGDESSSLNEEALTLRLIYAFTPFEQHGLGLATLGHQPWGWARVAGLVLGCGALAALLSWAWNRPRPRSLPGCVGEAALLGLPVALGLWSLSDPLLTLLQHSLPPPRLVPFWLALPISLLTASTAGALALRLQLAPPREAEGEREQHFLVVVGERHVPWWRRTLA